MNAFEVIALYFSFFFLGKCKANETITTTLDSSQERSVAVVSQESFIYNIMLDAANNNNNRYTSVMIEKSMELPPELVQFILQLNTVDVSEFPTSMFVQSFPFSVFNTFITNFPWMDSYLSEYDMSTFKLPQDYATVLITITDSATVQYTAPQTSSLVAKTSVATTSVKATATSASASSHASSVSKSSKTSSNGTGKVGLSVPIWLVFAIICVFVL